MSMLSFFIPWEPSWLAATGLLAAAWCYMKGSGGEPAGRRLAFWTGFTLLYVMLQTQFDYYAEHAFFMHRTQNFVLHHLAPFLIAAAFPTQALRRGLPTPLCKMLDATAVSFPRVVSDAMSGPVTAVVIFNALIGFWLIPQIHLAGMMDWRLYRVMNWGMLVNGLMFWSLVLDPHSRHGLGKRIIMMLAACPGQIAMGALLCFSGRDFYPVYNICGRIFALSPIADQQIGGIILWVPGTMMSVVGVLFVIWRELRAAFAPAPRLPPRASLDLP